MFLANSVLVLFRFEIDLQNDSQRSFKNWPNTMKLYTWLGNSKKLCLFEKFMKLWFHFWPLCFSMQATRLKNANNTFEVVEKLRKWRENWALILWYRKNVQKRNEKEKNKKTEQWTILPTISLTSHYLLPHFFQRITVKLKFSTCFCTVGDIILYNFWPSWKGQVLAVLNFLHNK